MTVSNKPPYCLDSAMFKLILIFLSVTVSYVCSYNILVVFPYPGKSHAILGEGYVRHLLNAGHEVTYVTARLYNPHPRLKQVDVSSNIATFDIEKSLDFKIFLEQGGFQIDTPSMYELMRDLANKAIVHENVQKFLMETKDKYDLAITEWLYSELYSGFPAVLNLTYIWSSSMEPHPAILGLIDEPGNPAYFPDHSSPVTLPMTFTQRVKELWGLIYLNIIRWRTKDLDEQAYQNAFGPIAAKRGITIPTLEEMKYKSALVLGNSHVSSGEAQKLPQNYIPISGYHIDEEVNPLPEDLQKLMDSSPNGVIYFSMGTMMKSATMPDEFKRALLKVFGGLKQTVIWKFEEKLSDVPKNVHVVHWAPQQSILAHPNCIVFVSHGGLLSTTEALHFGVPIIGIPLFADQHLNVKRAVNKGFGLQVDLGYDTPDNLKVAIHEMISNPKYRERVKELSLIYHHRPTTPGAALVHWVEHVIKTKGALHLQAPSFHVPLYQKLFLDLIALILLLIYIIIRYSKKLLGGSKKSEKSTLKKKN